MTEIIIAIVITLAIIGGAVYAFTRSSSGEDVEGTGRTDQDRSDSQDRVV